MSQNYNTYPDPRERVCNTVDYWRPLSPSSQPTTWEQALQKMHRRNQRVVWMFETEGAFQSPLQGEYCIVCGAFVEGFKYRLCCNNFDCGCMGRPLEPCICSEKCWDEMLGDRPTASIEGRVPWLE